jgi:hypothetical protein
MLPGQDRTRLGRLDPRGGYHRWLRRPTKFETESGQGLQDRVRLKLDPLMASRSSEPRRFLRLHAGGLDSVWGYC